jgi:tetratricopeptide (TPR) repeat protein
MATSEIEKLERRYAENPHGLTFAPLAEVHRKNGDITRALELLRVGLELHPNYIPASIVLGRCHQDLGDLPAAEEAFSHVLRLDDENVIALKSLADINERQEKLEEAEQWLRRLVSVDRSNEEAREQLEQIETLKLQQRRRAAAAPKPAPVKEPPAPAASESPAISESPVPSESPAPSQSPAVSPSPAPSESPATSRAAEIKPSVAEQAVPDLEPIDLSEVLTEAKAADQGEAAPIPEPAPSSTIPGLISSAFEPPPANSPPSAPLDLEIEVEQDVVLKSSGAAEFSVPDATQDLLELAAKLNSSRPRTPGRRASDKAAAERLERLEAERLEAERRETERVEAERREAEQIEAQRREAERLESERLEAERREAEPQVATRAEAPAPTREPDQPSAPGRSYVASETRGQSVAAFFQALLLARPPEAVEPATPRSETDSVQQDGRPTPPDSEVSFDDFFGSAASGSAPASRGDSEPSKEDLDQFQSWLQNLKR